MPFKHVLHHDSQLVIVKGTGEGSLEEIVDSVQRLFQDESIGTEYRLMINVDETTLDPTPDEMMTIVSLVETLRSRFTGRIAIVTSLPGRVTTATLVAFAADHGCESIRHFISERDAREWLLNVRAVA